MAEPQQISVPSIPPPSVPMRPVDIVSSKEDAPALAFFKERSTVERLADEDIRDRQADRDLREKYAKKAFILACAILIFWGVIIITVGLWFGCSGEKVQPLSDKVLMAITAGATANVFAAFLGVIRGLFPGREKSHRKSEL